MQGATRNQMACALPAPGQARTARRASPAAVVRAQAGNEEAAPGLGRRQALLLGTAVMVGAAGVAPSAKAGAECTEFTTAANGLQWCDSVPGDGPAPTSGAMIRCHYTGRLASNGAVFDSSYERGRPLQFKVGVRQVIAGWDLGILGDEELGVPGMREGGKRRLVIPADLAYGARGIGPIPPNSILVFDVELLGKRRPG